MKLERRLIENPFVALPEFNCIACGPKHPHGLKLQFYQVGDAVEASLEPRADLDGITGIMHGGIQAMILDEVMWWAVFNAKRRFCVTQSMAVEFKGIVRSQNALIARARIVDENRNTVRTMAEILSGSKGLACAQATYFLPNEKLFARAQGLKVGDLPEVFRRYLAEPA